MEWLLLAVCISSGKFQYICGITAERFIFQGECEAAIVERYSGGEAACIPVAAIPADKAINLSLPTRKPVAPCRNATQATACR